MKHVLAKITTMQKMVLKLTNELQMAKIETDRHIDV